MWKKTSEVLPCIEDKEYFQSRDVLIYDGKTIRIGYLYKYSDDSIEWKLQGRDAYNIEGITHWADLPIVPERQEIKGE